MTHFRSFFRRSRADASAAHPVAIAFDRFLDAKVSGVSTPDPDASRQPSFSPTDRAQFDALAATVRHIVQMDDEERAASTSSARTEATIWEDIMSATAHPLPVVKESAIGKLPQTLRPKPDKRDDWATTGSPSTSSRWWPRFSPVLNVAMAAILLLVLGLSAFAVTGGIDRWRSDSGGGQGNHNELASLVAQNEGTPVAQTRLPTADECTVTPLTVDEVMTRIKGPFPGQIDNVPVMEASAIADATPPLIRNVPPTQEDIDQIAAVQREYVACIMEGNLLKVWTFYAPSSAFWQTFLDRYPAFTDEATVRSDLEAYLGGATNYFLPGFGYYDGLPPLVNPDPQASLVIGDQLTSQGRVAYIETAMLYYDPDAPDAPPRSTPRDQVYRNWEYVWNQTDQVWQIVIVGIEANRG